MTTEYERSREQTRDRRDRETDKVVDVRRTLREWIDSDSVRFVSLHSEKYQNPTLSRQYLLTYFGDVLIELYKRADETQPATLSYDGHNRILQPSLLYSTIWVNEEGLPDGFRHDDLTSTDRVVKEGLVHLILTKLDRGAVLKIRAKRVPPCG